MPAEDDLFKAIESHLAYFGYRTKSEEGILKAVEGPAGLSLFWVYPVNQGATFRTVFKTGPNAKTEQIGFSNFVNQANTLAIVSRFSAVENGQFLAIEAWFPPSYTREAFAIFFSRYVADINAPAFFDRATVLKFFPAEGAPPESD
jgi:hypothetical protein